MTVFAIAIQT